MPDSLDAETSRSATASTSLPGITHPGRPPRDSLYYTILLLNLVCGNSIVAVFASRAWVMALVLALPFSLSSVLWISKTLKRMEAQRTARSVGLAMSATLMTVFTAALVYAVLFFLFWAFAKGEVRMDAVLAVFALVGLGGAIFSIPMMFLNAVLYCAYQRKLTKKTIGSVADVF